MGRPLSNFVIVVLLMAHWQALYPARIMTLPYEMLVEDIEGQARALAGFCGLDWDPAMAHPEDNTGVVRTASFTQVRQGVHSRSVGRWRAHAEMLAPFIDGLDPELWPEIAEE